MTYTGYRFEELMQMGETQPEILSLLRVCDVLVDGPFLLSQKSLMLHFRGQPQPTDFGCPQKFAGRVCHIGSLAGGW